MHRKFLIALTLCCLTGAAFPAAANDENSSSRSKRSKKLDIKVVPWGPSQAEVDAVRARVAASEAVRRELSGAKFREVGFEYIYPELAGKTDASRPPTRFRIIYYSYSTDLALFVEGDFAGREPLSARWENVVPGVGAEEIEAAYRVVEQDPKIAAARQTKKLDYYEAMPPTTVINGERLVNIGITDPKTGENEIVGVSFKNNKVVRYENNAPPTSAATPEACGISNAGQGSTGPGVAGQSTLTVNDGAGVLWEMLVIRPSSSSGASFERSGLEIRDVKYRGKSVLRRGHVPILNVKYVNSCGPFRDWQYGEGFFSAPDAGSQNPAPGIRILAAGQVATTAIETRNDSGNFQGVAIYTQDVGLGQEVVMVTEMNAGWYRYVMEWRFAQDGTIRPRYGFASVTDSCVCIQRTHHVYWRFDFDIVGSNNQVYLTERGRKHRTLLETETALFKKPQNYRGLEIKNSAGDEAYQLIPGLNDGLVTDASGNLIDTFGGGDFWVLRFKGTPAAPTELDDIDIGAQANISPWVNGESLVDQDVVVWYAGHQVRVDDASRVAAPEVITGSHIIGPILRPIRW